MNRRLCVLAIGLAAFIYATPIVAQQCLHGTNEDATQKARRQAALTLMRSINTTEAYLHVQSKTFVPFAKLELDLSKVPDFDVQLTTDGDSYSVVARDKADPCGFAFFTNQTGVIFQGYPIDFEVQPTKR